MKKAILVVLVIIAGLLAYIAFKPQTPPVYPDDQATLGREVMMIEDREDVDGTTEQSGRLVGHVSATYCGGYPLIDDAGNYTARPCRASSKADYKVNIKNSTTLIEKNIISDSDGNFQLELYPGIYTVSGVDSGPGAAVDSRVVTIVADKESSVELTVKYLLP